MPNCTPFFLSSLQTSRKMDPKKENPLKEDGNCRRKPSLQMTK
jgi:hypothetical protein